MIQVAGVQLIEQIYKSDFSSVYRGTRSRDSQSVILKLLNREVLNLIEKNDFERKK